MKELRFAIIGCGGITLQNHLPGLALCPETKITALCDSDPAVLERARSQSGIELCCPDYRELVRRDDVDAVIIATPNLFHAPIVREAIAARKHVLCEKPLAMNLGEALELYRAAEEAGVRHMTAFTYRFVPAMRYLVHLAGQGDIGQLYHFRSCRLQDWGTRALGWRQESRLAGTGELGDMLSHRIDYAHMLAGPMERLVAHRRRFHDLRDGQPSDLEDWVTILADFTNGATGVLESSKVATGRGESAHSQDYVEVNGTDGTMVYQMEQPHQLQIAQKGEKQLRTVPLPRDFLKWPGSPRDPDAGDPLFNFRYDQAFEFVDAIRNERPCRPSFFDGVMAQAAMDAAVLSAEQARWVKVQDIKEFAKADLAGAVS